MPYKSESIRLQGLQDRRRKLTDEQKSEIRRLYETGDYSMKALAERFLVSKKTVLLLVNPESARKAAEYRKANWKVFQKPTEVHTETMREYRRYKQSLYLKGELKEDTGI